MVGLSNHEVALAGRAKTSPFHKLRMRSTAVAASKLLPSSHPSQVP